MNVYMSEQEQIEIVKDWWKKYGVSVIIGVIIALAISFGWRYWQQHQQQTAEQASALYEQMLMQSTNHQMFAPTAEQLIKQYSRTPYAALASLTLADQAVNQNNLADALQKLQWVIDHAGDKGLVQIAKVRAARVLLAQNQPQEALQLLQTVHDKSFIGLAALVKGDALLALNKKEEARSAYQNALNSLPDKAAIRSLVQMKLDNLAM